MAEPAFYLLLLKTPLDTIEGVQEVTKMVDAPVHINDATILSQYFPEAEEHSSAVLLDKTAATSIDAWAARHKAIYSLQLVPLDAPSTRVVVQAAQKLEWPCWVFVPNKIHHNWLQSIMDDQPAAKIHTARITGYQYSSDGLQCIIQPSASLQPTSESSTASIKFRPAQDVLSRLRHDPGIRQADYQVVYEDRFAGEMVLDLELWKTDVSDEEFIPMHRVLKFKRKWDDVVIWDRNARVDFLFGDECAVPYVAGRAVRISSAEEGRKFSESAPDFTKATPCVVEFPEASYDKAKAYMFEVRS